MLYSLQISFDCVLKFKLGSDILPEHKSFKKTNKQTTVSHLCFFPERMQKCYQTHPNHTKVRKA